MAPESTASPLVQFFPFILIFLIFYILVIRPEKNKQRQRQSEIAALKKNDAVVTSGGIHGTVVNVKDKTFIVRIDDNVKIEIDKESVSTILPK